MSLANIAVNCQLNIPVQLIFTSHVLRVYYRDLLKLTFGAGVHSDTQRVSRDSHCKQSYSFIFYSLSLSLFGHNLSSNIFAGDLCVTGMFSILKPGEMKTKTGCSVLIFSIL